MNICNGHAIASIKFKGRLCECATEFRETYVLLRERVNELGKDLVGDNGLSELIRVVGEAAESQSSRLLNGRHVVQKEGAEESHNT